MKKSDDWTEHPERKESRWRLLSYQQPILINKKEFSRIGREYVRLLGWRSLIQIFLCLAEMLLRFLRKLNVGIKSKNRPSPSKKEKKVNLTAPWEITHYY